MTTTSYSTKATAIRGAKRAGLVEGKFTVEIDSNGRWVIGMTHEQVNAPQVDEHPAEAGEVVDEPVRVPTYKEIAYRATPSVIEKPVAFIHAWLSDNVNLTRKEATVALVNMGINYSTVRTQYQRWFSSRKVRKIGAR